jgi:hypothetical protein
MKGDVEQRTADYDKKCSASGLAAFAHTLSNLNEFDSENDHATEASLRRAKLRISCGTLASGDTLFLCEAKQLCKERYQDLVDRRVALNKQNDITPALPNQPRTDDIPPPEPVAPVKVQEAKDAGPETIAVKEVIISAQPPTGQSAVNNPSSNSACGVPETLELKGGAAAAAHHYRRSRMIKQARYELCAANSVTDQDRQACALVVKPMAMSDLRANGNYLLSHPAADAFLKCLKKDRDAKSTDADLAGAEAGCLGTDSAQSIYMADLPDCRIARASSSVSVSDPVDKKDAAPASTSEAGAAKASAAH